MRVREVYVARATRNRSEWRSRGGAPGGHHPRVDAPIEAFGEEVTEGTGTVTWSGGRIEPGEFETFAFSAGPVPEGEMSFPALQTYDSGEVVRWTGPPDAEEPAARVNLFDLGTEEGQGELAVLAELAD